ncbi:MAG: DUF6069 family protein [Thermomicrobiales bacterium]
MAEISPAAETRGTDWQRLVITAVVAAVTAAVINAIVYGIARWLDTIPRDVVIPGPSGDEPLGLVSVVFASVTGALGAAIVYALCARFPQRPIRLFQSFATLVLLLSFASPFTISGAPAKMIATLILMHIVVWAVIIVTLPRASRP